MYLRIHPSQNGSVAALCDAELIGRVLSQGKVKIDLEKYAGFYKGDKVGGAEAAEALRNAASINIVGKKSLAAAKEAGLDVKGAILVSGVPHLQAYRV